MPDHHPEIVRDFLETAAHLRDCIRRTVHLLHMLPDHDRDRLEAMRLTAATFARELDLAGRDVSARRITLVDAPNPYGFKV